jgi:ADP-ribosylglycohydrolase
MSVECSDKDWIIALAVRPNQMSAIDPPSNNDNENYSRLLSSIYAMTLGESLSSHDIDPYILEHIQIEKECSEQDDLTLVWSDDVSLTLCFLASLAHHGKYSQEHLLQRYFQWWMNG